MTDIDFNLTTPNATTGLPFFTANRELKNGQLHVAGAPARATYFDRGRACRFQLQREQLQRAEAAPYSLRSEALLWAGHKISRAFSLAGSISMIVFGAAMLASGAVGIRQPDLMLLPDHGPGMTVTSHRDALLFLMAFGLCAAWSGLHHTRKWFKSTTTPRRRYS